MPVVDLGTVLPDATCTDWVDPTGLCCAVSGIASDEAIATAISSASSVLWALSGRRFGACPLPPLRPCQRRCHREPWPTLGRNWDHYGTAPNLAQSVAWYTGCGLCTNDVEDCSCTRLQQVRIPGPVAALSQVTVDGIVLPTSAYRVDRVGHRWYLVRIDGGTWPYCQNMAADLTQPNTFGLTGLHRGRPIPAAGVSAAGELACELVKSCLPGEKCRLPSRVTSLTRNGTTIAALDPMTFLDKGLTGLYRVDLFLAAYNPNRLRRAASVASPDSLNRRNRKVGA